MKLRRSKAARDIRAGRITPGSSFDQLCVPGAVMRISYEKIPVFFSLRTRNRQKTTEITVNGVTTLYHVNQIHHRDMNVYARFTNNFNALARQRAAQGSLVPEPIVHQVHEDLARSHVLIADANAHPDEWVASEGGPIPFHQDGFTWPPPMTEKF